MSQLKINDIIALLGDLPTMPGIAIKILEVIRRDESSLEDIGAILSNDPPLSAKVLKAANSPLYGGRGKISSIPQAVKILGTNAVKNLALSFTIIDKFNNVDNGFNYTQFWKNSLTTAVAAKIISEKIIPHMAEDAFFIGLLADIGILVCTECIPDQYNLVLKERIMKKCTFQEAEDQILGFNHMDIGAYMLEEWGLPNSFSNTIRWHHFPEKADSQENIIFIRLLHVSSIYGDLFCNDEKGFPLGLLGYYFEEYGFADRIKVKEIAETISNQTEDIFPLFEIRISGRKSFSEILGEAKVELFNLNTNLIESLLSQKKQINELKKQVMRDSLTNLLNYKYFHEFLENELYRARRYKRIFSILMIDIDDFKRINDKEGHVAGDHILFTLAGLMVESFRRSDAIARYGGEEFAVILPDTDRRGATKLAERLRSSVQSMCTKFDNKDIRFTVSIGVVTYDPEEDLEKVDLVKRADTALYEAKKTGKNRFCVYKPDESTNDIIDSADR